MLTPGPLTAWVSGRATPLELPAVAWPLLLGALVATATVAWPRRRALVGAGLVMLLAVFAFEEAFHSVHHGLDPADAKGCSVAAASAHIAGATVDTAAVTDPILPPEGEPGPQPRTVRPVVRSSSPTQERAPPA